MKRVLLVIARFEFGGIPTQAFLWARFIGAHGFEPVILAGSSKDQRYCDLLSSYGIDYGILQSEPKGSGLINTFRYLLSLIRAINAWKAFAILPFNKTLAYNVNLIWRFTNVQRSYFLERNNFEDWSTSLWGNWLRKLALQNCTAIIFNSDSAATKSPHPHKTFVIKNSFNNPVHQSHKMADDPLSHVPQQAFVLLHVANISQQKNYPLLLACWKELKSRNPNLYLVIAGTEVREKLPAVMAGMKQEGILYLGSQSEVIPLIKRANLCLLSTFYEGCPNIILEYMSQKKLICASDVPALREVLADANHGLLFKNDSEADFIGKIKMAMSLNSHELNVIVSANLTKLYTNYSDRNYELIVELLKKKN